MSDNEKIQKIIRDIKEIGVYRQFLKTSSRIIGKSNKFTTLGEFMSCLEVFTSDCDYGYYNVSDSQLNCIESINSCFLAYYINQLNNLVKEFLNSESDLLRKFKTNLETMRGKTIDEYVSCRPSSHVNNFILQAFPWRTSPEGFDFWKTKSRLLRLGVKFW